VRIAAAAASKPIATISLFTNNSLPKGEPTLMNIASILLFLATALAQPASRPFTQQTLQDFLENSAPFDFVLIDVRSTPEVTAGIGSNSCRPYNLAWPAQFQQEIGRIPKDLAIIVYCAGGNRSRQAAAYLREAGYTNVYDAGGFLTWDGPTVPPSGIKPASALPEPACGTKSVRFVN